MVFLEEAVQNHCRIHIRSNRECGMLELLEFGQAEGNALRGVQCLPSARLNSTSFGDQIRWILMHEASSEHDACKRHFWFNIISGFVHHQRRMGGSSNVTSAAGNRRSGERNNLAENNSQKWHAARYYGSSVLNSSYPVRVAGDIQGTRKPSKDVQWTIPNVFSGVVTKSILLHECLFPWHLRKRTPGHYSIWDVKHRVQESRSNFHVFQDKVIQNSKYWAGHTTSWDFIFLHCLFSSGRKRRLWHEIASRKQKERIPSFVSSNPIPRRTIFLPASYRSQGWQYSFASDNQRAFCPFWRDYRAKNYRTSDDAKTSGNDSSL